MLAAGAWAGEMTDLEVRAAIVRESVASYPGSCACPESSDAAGRRCGARSAYSKPGGAKPICYVHEITDEQVKKFRARH